MPARRGAREPQPACPSLSRTARRDRRASNPTAGMSSTSRSGAKLRAARASRSARVSLRATWSKLLAPVPAQAASRSASSDWGALGSARARPCTVGTAARGLRGGVGRQGPSSIGITALLVEGRRRELSGRCRCGYFKVLAGQLERHRSAAAGETEPFPSPAPAGLPASRSRARDDAPERKRTFFAPVPVSVEEDARGPRLNYEFGRVIWLTACLQAFIRSGAMVTVLAASR